MSFAGDITDGWHCSSPSQSRARTIRGRWADRRDGWSGPANRQAEASAEDRSRRLICSASDREEPVRSEEHTSELQSLMRISYAVFCLKKKKKQAKHIICN